MVRLWRLVLLMVFSFFAIKGSAQSFNPKQKKLYKIFGDTLVLDSLSLVPGSVNYSGFVAGDSIKQPSIDYKTHSIIFHGKKPDSILVSYQRFPYNFEKQFFHKNPNALYTDFSKPNNPYTIRYDNNKQDNLFQNDGLNKNGNISRGVSFGNNQDMVLNSNLNLQVSGKLTPEIDLVMAATDNNIPFQADGTTAQLQEFDKVYIQLSNYNTKMVVGDYQLSRPQNSYFMSFYKRAQGLYLENSYTDSAAKKPLVFKTQVSGAVSRGKFSRQVFFGTEANQGPYRLQGADSEPFIIILSGTEKIYIDGKLLQRGQENDYIIDYNTGELTFTAKQLITKDKRIVAEFQYAERNYSRSLFFFGEEVQTKKARFFFNAYNEQDNKNKPLQQTLSQDQKKVLIGVGDSLNQAVYTGVQQVAFNRSDVFYKKIDTLVNGVHDSIFVYSTDSLVAKYRLTFSSVGANKGNYNQINSSANGKVYQWVAPMDGILQGSYEPVIPLVTPKQSQMLTGGFSYSFTPNNSLSTEGVFTKNDVNKFSTKDKGNDEGSGVKVVSKNQTIIGEDSLHRKTKLIYNFNYEFVQKQFRQIERFRSIEFDRDWNRPLTGVLLNDQSIASADLGLTKGNNSSFLYSLNLFDEGKNYKGLRHNVSANYLNKTFSGSYTGAYLTTQDQSTFQNTKFYRHKTSFSQKVNGLKFSYNDVFEHNLFIKSMSDSLLPRAYQFWEWEGSESNADSSKNNIKLFYRERRDKLAYNRGLQDSTFARNVGVQANVYSIKNNPITILVTYRKLELSKNIVGQSLQPDNTLLNRVEYNPKYFKGLITSNVFYETGYGLQNKQEFYYLQVVPGQGQYAWIDYNGNGIKELNEFEISQFADQAQYIRIYTPTNQYQKVLQNQLSISLNVRPASLWHREKSHAIKFVKRWSLQTAMRIDNKIADDKSSEALNPFAIVKDTVLLGANNNLRQSVFFNQTSAIFGADYTYIKNKSVQLLTYGLESKALYSNEIKWRLNFFKAWSINSDNTLSTKQNTSKYFSTRNYNIKAIETEQKLIYQPNTIFRISGIYKYSDKHNVISEDFGGNQQAYINTLGIELKYNQTEKGSLTGRLDYIKITYNGDVNSSIAYEMLSGLNVGNNFTWELTYQRNLGNNIQISINYNGRKTPNAPAVHLGGAQVRAFF